jgi:hypothetical protein
VVKARIASRIQDLLYTKHHIWVNYVKDYVLIFNIKGRKDRNTTDDGTHPNEMCLLLAELQKAQLLVMGSAYDVFEGLHKCNEIQYPFQ